MDKMNLICTIPINFTPIMAKEKTDKGIETVEDKMSQNILVLGPCSAESRDQVLEVAKHVARWYPKAIFRAGIWKPRTRPNNFEGIGEIGLDWLSEVRQTTGLRIATEVANTKHVELCLNKGIDVLWLGARTTVNPFYVQEIAEALKGFEGTVMVKNPVVPDINLWLGAIERIEQVGISDVIAIHRGFHHYDSKPYRNLPQWEIPIELMSKREDIPIVCDISHISGNPSLFESLAQKAMDLEMAGLHIEVHSNPKNALSDAEQQITPSELDVLLSSIEKRNPFTDNIDFITKLEKLRSEIDDIDSNLLKNFHRRMLLVRNIGEIKKQNKVTILQVTRWKKIVSRYMDEGKALGLSKSFLEGLLNGLHDEGMRNQNDVMN